MKFIREMVDRRKVWAGLRGYPIYSPPYRYVESIPSRDEMRANFNYFLEAKAARLKCLAAYLAPFSVELRFEPAALQALDDWLYRYGGHLTPRVAGRIMAVHYFDPAWEGPHHGLNIVNDVATFAGDYVVSRNKDARWDVWYGHNVKSDYEKDGFGQPCIFEPRSRTPHPMLMEIFQCCDAGRMRLSQRPVLQGLVDWQRLGEFVRLVNRLSDANPSEPVA